MTVEPRYPKFTIPVIPPHVPQYEVVRQRLDGRVIPTKITEAGLRKALLAIDLDNEAIDKLLALAALISKEN
jgi:hypothetical protein